MMSKFGLQDMSQVTFVVSVPRFQILSKQIAIESGTDDSGGAILQESGTIDTTTSFDSSINKFDNSFDLPVFERFDSTSFRFDNTNKKFDIGA